MGSNFSKNMQGLNTGQRNQKYCYNFIFPSLLSAILILSCAFAVGSHELHLVNRATAATTQNQTIGIVIPLYIYPGATWTTVAQAKQGNPNVPFIAVINPNSGPGTSLDPNYVQGIQQLQAAGITVLGYVDTAYAADTLESV